MSSEVPRAGERPQSGSDRSYRYRAFISYRHVEPDRRWANWLHSAIESYRVPKRLHGNAAGQTRLGRVFRDEEELSASADLSREIKAALDESNFLVVVCSPRTPASEWVNQEVVYFRELGRDDRILALLIDGEPRESFPRALCAIRPVAAAGAQASQGQIAEIEPLAADVRPIRSEPMRRVRRTALLRLLASLLGCRFDDLRQRDHERRLRQLAYLGVFFATMSAIMVGMATFAVYQRGQAVTALAKEKAALAEKGEALAKEQAARVQEQSALAKEKAALVKEQEAVKKLTEEQTRLKQQLARQYIERGARLCEDGKNGLGLATLFLAHEAAPPGDPLQAAACGLLGGCSVRAAVPLGHLDKVEAVAFSPDGRTVVTGSRTGAQLWDADADAAKGVLLRPHGEEDDKAFRHAEQPKEFEDYRSEMFYSWSKTPIRAVAFSPDGRTVFTGWTSFPQVLGNAQLCDAATGAPKGGRIWLSEGTVTAVAFSPNGQTVLTGWEAAFSYTKGSGGARLWDAATGAEKGKPMQHDDRVHAVAFSPDGRTVLTGSDDKTARLWDAGTGEPKGEPLRHEDRVVAVAYSPDGQTALTGSHDCTARLWDTATGAPRGKPMRHDGGVYAVAFSPDGKTVLTGSGDKTARLWEATAGAPKGESMRHEDTVVAVAYSPDGRTVLTGSDDNTVRLWDAATGAPKGGPMRHDDKLTAAAFSPDGRRVLTCTGETAWLWDVAAGAAKGKPIRHDGAVEAVAFSPDGRTILTGGADHTVRLWDATTGAPKGETLRHNGHVAAVVFSPDSRTVLTGSYDWTARLWDATTGTAKGEPMLHKHGVEAVAFSPDGRTVLTGGSYDDETARLWDATTGAPKGEPIRHDGPVRAVAFSPDSRTVVTGSGNAARLWDTATGAPRGKPMRHGKTETDSFADVNAVAFSPDGRTVLTGSYDQTARLWDAVTGAPKGEPMRHEGNVRAVAFSPDGRTMLTRWSGPALGGWGSQHEHFAGAQLWDAATGAPKGEPMRHQDAVTVAAFSPDGRTVLTGSLDHTARLWDAATGAPRGEPMRHEGEVKAAAFSPDGRTVLTGSSDGTARLWEVPAPLADDPPGRLRLTVEVRTGFRANGQGQLTTLSSTEWDESWRQLLELGGPSRPYSAAESERMAVEYYLGAAWECEQARQWLAAAVHLRQLLARQPDDYALLTRRGRAFAEQAEWSRAIADLAEAIRSKPDNDIGLCRLALARFGGGDVAGYRADCEKLLVRTGVSNDAGIVRTVSWLGVLTPFDRPEDVKPWIVLSDKALAKKPTSWSSLQTLGAALYRAGQFQNAIKRLDEAAAEWVKAQTDDKTKEHGGTVWIQLFLAMAHQRLGHVDEAKRFFEQAASQIEADNAQRPWDDRLTRETLRREAEKLLATPAAEPTKK